GQGSEQNSEQGPGQGSGQGSQTSPEQRGATSTGEQPAGERVRGSVMPGSVMPGSIMPGSISGTVVDQSGAVVAGARVKLRGEDSAASQETLTGSDGTFSFAGVAPGPFQLTIVAAGFAPQASSGILHAGENYIVPGTALAVATTVTDVEVGVSQVEVAEEQMKVEEKQRVLGIVPNFYVSYIPDAAPLNTRQKFKLAWKTVIDPVTIAFVGGAAGVQQAQNHFEGYGQGAQGYAKRFGAGFADTVSGTFIGGAILPSLLKQDPRYFYKGTGSKTARILYAIANAVICKGDNRRWQANYSGILGSLAAGGISNLYYPAQDRDGAALTFENAALGIGGSAISNLFQEFVVKKLTPRVPDNGTARP
ncbi:MAG: carboxypeptidase-like regulatory domain-containing protein, partial [Candidatus Sulfotelmatobacter sp.]